MYLQQIYTGCLSEAAYFVESKGEAIVIDPLRDTELRVRSQDAPDAPRHQDLPPFLRRSASKNRF